MASLNNSFHKLAKGAGVSFAGQIVSTAFKFLTQITLAWLLGAKFFGIYTLGLVIYQIGDMFARMGLEIGAVRYVSIHYGSDDKQRLKGVLLQTIGLPFINGILLGIAVFLSSDVIAHKIFNTPELVPIIKIFAIAIPFGASMTTGVFATTGFHTTKYRVYIWDILIPFINLLLAVLFCTIGWELWGAGLAWLLALILGSANTLYCIYKIFPEIVHGKIKPIFESKQLLKFSLPLSFGTFLWFFLIWTDIVLLGYFRTADEVGIYRAASQTAFLMILFTRSFVTIFTPMIATLYSQGKHEEVEKLFRKTSRWNFAFTVPLFLILVIASKELLSLFGSEFANGALPLAILAAGQLMNSGAGGFSMHLLTMSGHQYLKLYGDLALAVINVILNITLIPHWGLVGAAVATAISIAGVKLFQVIQVQRILNIRSSDWSFLKTIGAAIISALGGFTIHAYFQSLHFLLLLIITAATIVIIYFAILILMGLEKEERVVLEKTLKQIFPKLS